MLSKPNALVIEQMNKAKHATGVMEHEPYQYADIKTAQSSASASVTRWSGC